MLDYESIPPNQGTAAPRVLVWYLWFMPLVTGSIPLAMFVDLVRSDDPSPAVLLGCVPASPYLATMYAAFWSAHCKPWHRFNTYLAAIALTVVCGGGAAVNRGIRVLVSLGPFEGVWFFLLIPAIQWTILVPAAALVLGVTSAYRRRLSNQDPPTHP